MSNDSIPYRHDFFLHFHIFISVINNLPIHTGIPGSYDWLLPTYMCVALPLFLSILDGCPYQLSSAYSHPFFTSFFPSVTLFLVLMYKYKERAKLATVSLSCCGYI
ncbi:hypothetical protein CPB84DRAFT_1473702 [Gymnopilus junonius]|uniref:Uncharacterized protein n=1 Tax=Gymnopilus junonius TaxID=109634 RepID=A0A9P5TKQ6_GYMJU|nr:hypothetical protein CPB84DRAFT_1473702 [Gymnopilus junonius]